jgi:hypothetical protein
MNYIYNFFGGKSTFFAFWFFAFGVVLEFRGKLDGNFLALAGALQTLIALRSLGDDYHVRGMQSIQPLAPYVPPQPPAPMPSTSITVTENPAPAPDPTQVQPPPAPGTVTIVS